LRVGLLVRGKPGRGFPGCRCGGAAGTSAPVIAGGSRARPVKRRLLPGIENSGSGREGENWDRPAPGPPSGFVRILLGFSAGGIAGACPGRPPIASPSLRGQTPAPYGSFSSQVCASTS
jgi:hypothetical protein